MRTEHTEHSAGETPVHRLLEEQHLEMEELLAESEGRLSEQLREKQR